MRLLFSALSLFTVASSSTTGADPWLLDPEASSLTIVADAYEGTPFAAEFDRFDADIVFDANDLSRAAVVAHIETGSFTAADEHDALFAFEAQGADWLSVGQFPIAVFKSHAFHPLGGGRYQVDGTLELKGQRHQLSFPFDLTVEGDQARVQAAFPVDRFHLGLGRLTHPTEASIAFAVQVRLDLVASRQR